MNTIITIDIGNTNITAGIFYGPRLIGKRRFPTHKYSSYESGFKGFLKAHRVDLESSRPVVISSVVPVSLARLVMHLNNIMRPRFIIAGRDVKVPIRNLYRNKAEVGQDRLVNAYAASSIYGAPCVVVDLGTAITFDVVSKKGEYLGGLILPGIEISLRSLYEKTALLPRVELKKAPSIIGKDTVNSMRGGILFGFGAMCDCLSSKYRKILGKKTKIIATGGNAGLMKEYTSSIQIVDEDLTLKGLLLLASE